MPVIPLHNVDTLSETLVKFHRSISTTSPPPTQPANPVLTLLPYCSTMYPNLPEHSVWKLTEICNSIPSVAETATTEGGKEAIREALSDQGNAAEKVIEFWKEEILL